MRHFLRLRQSTSAPRVRAVLWDLDGTLTDSVRFVVDTANRVIEAHGGTALEFDRIGAMTGLPLRAIFRLAWPDLTEDEATSRTDDCEKILRGLAIKDEIEVYLGGDSVKRHKPAPDLALLAVERLGVRPDEAVVVGDAPADIDMARAAGMRAVQVTWGFSKTKLPNADVLVETWADLRRTVLAMTAIQ